MKTFVNIIDVRRCSSILTRSVTVLMAVVVVVVVVAVVVVVVVVAVEVLMIVGSVWVRGK